MMSEKSQVSEGYKKTELGVIPEDWRIFQIDQLANINRESRDPKKDLEEFFNYIDIDAVENGTGLIKNPKRLFGKEAPSRARRVIHKDDVIMSTVRPYHKAFALVPNLYDNQICSTGFAVLSCGKNLDPKYLLQYLFSDTVIDQCTSMMGGGQYPALNTTQVSKIKITLPPLPEQQKIASILLKVDEQLEQTEQVIEKTELLKEELMQKLLTKGIGHTKFKKTELGEIPEEWEIVKVNAFCDVKTGGTPSTKNKDYWDGDILWMSSGEINKKFIYDTDKKITEQGLENSNARILPKDTVMMALNGQGKTRGTVAVLKIPSTCNQSLACLIPDKNKSHYLYLYYNLQKRYSEIRNITGDTGREGLNLKILKDILIPLPKLEEQLKIASILSKVDSQIQDNQSYLTKLRELKKGLMQDLLTGKVRVCA